MLGTTCILEKKDYLYGAECNLQCELLVKIVYHLFIKCQIHMVETNLKCICVAINEKCLTIMTKVPSKTGRDITVVLEDFRFSFTFLNIGNFFLKVL